MSDVRLKITRNDIAKMLNTTDQRIIAQFEQLFKQASQTTPDNVTALQSAVDLLLSSPATQPNRLDRQEDVVAPNNVNGMVLIFNATTGKWVAANLTAGSGVAITNSAGGITISVGSISSLAADLTNTNATYLMSTNQTMPNGAGGSAGTLTNAPSVGNPTKWISINDNGTTRKIPAW
jgi:hypothetical protein